MDLLSDEDVFQNDDNKSEASSYVSEEQTSVVVRKTDNSKTTPRTAGNGYRRFSNIYERQVRGFRGEAS